MLLELLGLSVLFLLGLVVFLFVPLALAGGGLVSRPHEYVHAAYVKYLTESGDDGE